MYAISGPIRRLPPVLSSTRALATSLARSFFWALEMSRECERFRSSGQSLDAATIHDLAARLERSGRTL